MQGVFQKVPTCKIYLVTYFEFRIEKHRSEQESG